MTVNGCFVLLSPSPLIPLPSRERGILSVALSCSPVSPCRPVDSRLRGNDGVEGLSCCHPLLPVSGTGTGFGPLPSRERGLVVRPRPVDTALKPV